MEKNCKVMIGLYPEYRELGIMNPNAVMGYASANGYELMGRYNYKDGYDNVVLYVKCNENGIILSQMLVMKA